MDNLLSIVTFTPAIAGVILAVFLRGEDEMAQRNARWVALFATVLTFLVSLFILFGFETGVPGFQFVEDHDWMLGLTYKMGVDGISVMFIVLTTFLMPLVVAASWDVTFRVKEYMIAFLLLETFILGALMALDMVLFFLFFEAAMVPLFLIIGIWGGAGRLTASYRAVLASAFGAVLLLSSMIVMFTEAGSTDFERLFDHQFNTEDVTILGLDVAGGMQTLLFLGLSLGLLVKLPLWPLHAWQPDAQVQAPIAGSVVLSSMLTMLASYGLLRIALPIFPSGMIQLTPLFFALASVTALYAALTAMVQTDMRRLVAFFVMAQSAIAVMGVFSANRQGLDGAIKLVICQGLVAAGIVMATGVLMARQNDTRIEAFGGLSLRMPVFAALLLLLVWAAIGLPGTAGFVAFVVTLTGLFQANSWTALVALLSLALLAVAGLGMFRRVMRGDLNKESLKSVEDLTLREQLTFAPLAIAIVALGLFPSFVTERVRPATDGLTVLFEMERQRAAQATLSADGASLSTRDSQ